LVIKHYSNLITVHKSPVDQVGTNFHYLPVFAQQITTVMSHPILQFQTPRSHVHRCTAEDASVALPRRVLGQGVSVGRLKAVCLVPEIEITRSGRGAGVHGAVGCDVRGKKVVFKKLKITIVIL